MTKKHFQAITDSLKEVRPFVANLDNPEYVQWLKCCDKLADACNDFNEGFSYTRFFQACGIADTEDLEDINNEEEDE